MASRSKTTGLKIYSLLKKELSAANKNLRKPLTRKQQDKILKTKLFPAYKERSYSSIRKGDVRKKIIGSIRSLRRKRSSATSVYNRLLHELTNLNAKIKESQQLSLKERRALVSNVLYPQFKGVPYRKIDWNKAIKKIGAELHRQQKDVCDILAIPENLYQLINYFELDDFIKQVLPPCIFMAVNAGKYGKTDIFNTRDYNYADSGVQSITQNINNAVRSREIEQETDKIPKYAGEIRLRPGKKNNGDPENYYLEMLLFINEEPVEEYEFLQIPKRKKLSKRKKKLADATKKYVQEGIKKLKAEKSKVKPIRKRIAQLETDIKIEKKLLERLVKRKLLSPANKNKALKDRYATEKKKLDNLKKTKVLKDFQYKELLSQIKKIFGQ